VCIEPDKTPLDLTVTHADSATFLPAYHLTSVELLLDCIRRLFGVAVDVKDSVDLKVGSLSRKSSVRRFFGVTVNIKNGVDLEVGPLSRISVGRLLGVTVDIKDSIDLEVGPLCLDFDWKSVVNESFLC
jgi:hypothetical protein